MPCPETQPGARNIQGLEFRHTNLHMFGLWPALSVMIGMLNLCVSTLQQGKVECDTDFEADALYRKSRLRSRASCA